MLASIRLPRDPNRYARFAILFNQLADAAGGTLTPKWLSDHENHCMKSNGTSLTDTVKAYLDLWGVSPSKVQPFKSFIVDGIFRCRAGDLGTAFYPSDGRYHNCVQERWRFECVSSVFMVHDGVINGSTCSCDNNLNENTHIPLPLLPLFYFCRIISLGSDAK